MGTLDPPPNKNTCTRMTRIERKAHVYAHGAHNSGDRSPDTHPGRAGHAHLLEDAIEAALLRLEDNSAFGHIGRLVPRGRQLQSCTAQSGDNGCLHD